MDPVVGEALRERLVLDEELDFEAGQQDLVEDPDDQLVLTDRKALHRIAGGYHDAREGHGRNVRLYAPGPQIVTGSPVRVAKLLAVAGVDVPGWERSRHRHGRRSPRPRAPRASRFSSAADDAEAALDAQARMTGVDLVFARDQSPAPALVERLARAGAHVWLTKPARRCR